jgi:hypothetical protein
MVLRFPTTVLVALAFGAVADAQVQYNGIEQKGPFPPANTVSRKYQPVPYLEERPKVVPIDIGRQLFVDDFLIESTTLKRTFHRPQIHPASPVLRRESEKEYAAPFSDGIFYDPSLKQFRAWYRCDRNTCYATSQDGITWVRPILDVEPGTNIVHKGPRDSSTIWLDLEETDPARRHKMLIYTRFKKEYSIELRASADGIHWSEPLGLGRTYLLPHYDRSTMFYNPFRKKWVYSVRLSNVGGMAAPELEEGIGRMRMYKEANDFAEGWKEKSELTQWASVDDRDLPHPEIKVLPQLYNLDATPYESLMLGMFNVWRGPENWDVKDRPKRNELVLAYSRDGFHWDRPDRTPFIGVSDKRGDWNWGNVQSVGGVCLIVGDKLYLYYSGLRGNPENIPKKNADQDGSMGLAILRRDGFASMDGGAKGELLTRPVRFSGKHLFVNADASKGSILAEVLDANGRVVKGFERSKAIPVKSNCTRLALHWKNGKDLAALAGQVVSIRFQVTNAKLYSFWVSGNANGASGGYVGAGGPEFKGPRDLE